MIIDNNYSTGDILPASWVVDVANEINDGVLHLSGGTVTGNLQVNGQIKPQANGTPSNPGILFGDNGAGVYGHNDVVGFVYGAEWKVAVHTDRVRVRNNLELGGDLQVNGVAEVGGKQVVTEGQLYTKKEIDDLLAARPLMKMCDKPTRVYDVRNPLKVLKWHKVQIPSTVGGVARSGAKAAYLNMTAINAPRQGWIAVRPDGSNWDPNNPSSIFSTMNLNPGAVENEHFLTEIGSNGAIQVWIHGLSASDDGVNGLVVDVIALVF